MTTPHRFAEMLVVGFVKHWRLSTVADAAGMPCVEADECEAIHAVAPFMPPGWVSYRRPVRAYIAGEWPKLSAHLLAHAAEPAKLLATVPQIERLTLSGRGPASNLSQEDRAEAAKLSRQRRNQRGDAAITGRAYESTLRGAWGTCKGRA